MKKQILFLLIFLTKANASLAQTQKMDCALTLGSREIAFTAGIPLLSPTVKLTLDFAVSRQIRIELNHIHPKSLIPTHIKNITLYTDTNSILLNKRNLNCSDQIQICEKELTWISNILETSYKYNLDKKSPETRIDAKYLNCTQENIQKFREKMKTQPSRTLQTETPVPSARPAQIAN